MEQYLRMCVLITVATVMLLTDVNLMHSVYMLAGSRSFAVKGFWTFCDIYDLCMC
jgi:hypothetical protein